MVRQSRHKMRRGSPIGLPFLVALAAALSASQTIIENPAKATAKDAGRVLKLTEAWRITDKAGEFYFRRPRNLQIAADGSIFMVDAEQLLKFSPDGNFLMNLYKKGQGPGEIEDNYFYYVDGPDLFIQDMNSQRLWRTDLDGHVQEHISLAKEDYRSFLAVLPDGFLFLKSVWPAPEERTGKLLEILETVVFIARDGSWRKDVATFKPRDYLFPQGGMGWDPSVIKPSPDGSLLYALHSQDYLIEVVDLASGATVKNITRQYPKVPHVENKWEPEFRKRSGAPKIEYESDIDDLYPDGGQLWVMTSTDDKVKGRLIDVFDKDGRFVDSFYLGLGRSLMAIQEDTIFCQEKSEDETITIVKYRIEK